MTNHELPVKVENSVRIIDSKRVIAAGNIAKEIEEFVGRVASGDSAISIARMQSPSGWIEPPQTPEFDEFSVVLRGELHVTYGGKTQILKAGQTAHAKAGVRVQYSTPGVDGADYIAVCLPAFSVAAVHRE